MIDERKEVSLTDGPCANDTPTHTPTPILKEQLGHLVLSVMIGVIGTLSFFGGLWATGNLNSGNIGVWKWAFGITTGLFFIFVNPKA